MASTQPRLIKVEIVNVMSVGTCCGYGTGHTLEEAVQDAMRRANAEYGDARREGNRVYVASPVRL